MYYKEWTNQGTRLVSLHFDGMIEDLAKSNNLSAEVLEYLIRDFVDLDSHEVFVSAIMSNALTEVDWEQLADCYNAWNEEVAYQYENT
jgi:hypothetical protein